MSVSNDHSYDSTLGGNDVRSPQYDYDAVSIPDSILDPQKAHLKYPEGGLIRRPTGTPVNGPYHENSMPNFVGSTTSETVYLITYEKSLSSRKWLVGPYCFLYMAAYVTSYFTFIQYVYAKIQTELFPEAENVTQTSPCVVNTSSPEYEKQNQVQQKSAEWGMYYGLAAGIPAIFSNIIFGSSTDKYGRKFLFFLPCLGTFVRMGISVVGIYLNFDLKYHLIGYVAEGITGQMFTMLLVCFTYAADLTAADGKLRSFAITTIELSIGIAVTIVSFSTGYFIQYTGFFYPMLSAGIMIAASFCIVLFIPESFPEEKRNPADSVVDKLKTAYDLFFGVFNRGRRWMYNILMVILFLTLFTTFGRSSVEPLYQLDSPFCWSPEKLGYFGALKSALQQMIGMGMIRPMQIIMTDETIAILGCGSYAAAYILEGVATTDTFMYIGKTPLLSCCTMN